MGNHWQPAFESKIEIQGVAAHVGEDVWNIKSEGKIQVADRSATLELKGKAKGNEIRLSGTGTLDNGEQFRLNLQGSFAPVAGEENLFVLTFNNASLHNLTTDVKIPLMQVGKVHVEAI